MVATLDDTKRMAIAQKLADMKALQNLLIANEEKLLQEITDSEISKRLQDFLSDDRKNLGILDTVIVQYGVQSEPKDTVKQLVEKTQEMMQGPS